MSQNLPLLQTMLINSATQTKYGSTASFFCVTELKLSLLRLKGYAIDTAKVYKAVRPASRQKLINSRKATSLFRKETKFITHNVSVFISSIIPELYFSEPMDLS